MKKLLTVLVFSIVLLLCFQNSAQAQTVKQWGVFEKTISSSNSYSSIQKYSQVTLNATFTGPGGKEYKVPGFWDGDNIWKIRFSPPSAGVWSYTIDSSDSQLNSSSNDGSFTSEAVTTTDINSNPNYRGFLKVSSNDRYLEYQDGTPFFWLGDTLWDGNTDEMGYADDFKALIDDRKAKGYTVIQILVGDLPPGEGRNDAANEGGPAFYNSDCTNVNPGNFQWLDQRIKYINDAGMVAGIWLHWTGQPPGGDALEDYARYLVARYQAYNVIWVMRGESAVPPERGIGNYISSIDTLGHIRTVHGGAGYHLTDSSQWYGYQPGSDEWCDIFLEQTNPWSESGSREHMVIGYNNNLGPMINSESGYEGMGSDADEERRKAWITFTSGGAGYTYGCNDIWNWEDAEQAGRDPRRKIDDPGSYNVSYVKKALENSQWWRLTPRDDLVSQGHCLAETNQEYIVYLVNSPGNYVNWNGSSIQLNLGSSGNSGTARWYHPETDQWHAGFSVTASGSRSFSTPNSSSQEWVLHVNFRGDFPSPTSAPTPTPIPGDLDGDDDVDIFDFNLLVSDFGWSGTAGSIPADIDSDGDVDIFDFNILVSNFTG